MYDGVLDDLQHMDIFSSSEDMSSSAALKRYAFQTFICNGGLTWVIAD